MPVANTGTASTPPPPAETPAPAGDMDFGGDTQTDIPEEPIDAPSDDKPFDDEPFDAGVEADEKSDPQKYIQQLSGKLGQSLRDYTDEKGQPDLELEKFAINSVVSATHTSEMDEEDRNDIIKKIESAGNDSEGNNSEEKDGLEGMDNGGEEPEGHDELDFGGELKENEGDFFIKPKKNSMFAPEGSDEFMEQNRIPEGKTITAKNLIIKGKNGIFAKAELRSKLQETFKIKDMSEPVVEPVVKPIIKPVEPATPRRNKPFVIEPDTVPVPPKAVNEGRVPYQVYHNTFSSAVQTARQMAEDRGYVIDDQEWFNEIATGPRKPAEGVTNRYTITLYDANGKEQKKALQIQVYGMGDRYELNMYIN